MEWAAAIARRWGPGTGASSQAGLPRQNAARGFPTPGSPCQPRGTASPCTPWASWLMEPSGQRAGRPTSSDGNQQATLLHAGDGKSRLHSALKPALSSSSGQAPFVCDSSQRRLLLPKPPFRKALLNVSQPVNLHQLLRGRHASLPAALPAHGSLT